MMIDTGGSSRFSTFKHLFVNFKKNPPIDMLTGKGEFICVVNG